MLVHVSGIILFYKKVQTVRIRLNWKHDTIFTAFVKQTGNFSNQIREHCFPGVIQENTHL